MAIRQVIARANQALDLADYGLYASFYTEDAMFTSGFGNSVRMVPSTLMLVMP